MITTLKSIWLDRSHQAWKVYCFLGLMGVDVCLFAAMLWHINHPGQPWRFNRLTVDEVTSALAFVALGVMAFALLCLSIRCVSCKKNVGWHILTTSRVGNWYVTLFSVQKCPYCGDDAAPPS
jgi:hypothetical protein